MRPGRKVAPVPDPDSLLGRFASDLRVLRREAGDPSYEALAHETARLAYPYSDTSLRNAAAGRTPPSREVTEMFVRACVSYAHAHPERAHERARTWDRRLVNVWMRRWRELRDGAPAAGTREPSRPPGPQTRGEGNLPAELTSFVGRGRQLAEARELLDSARLITLTGTGGVGKSRLALRLAADNAARYPDGAWLVELAGLEDPAMVGRTVASVLGVPTDVVRPPVDSLAAALAERRLLLVLDNCEHLLDAGAMLVHTLLRAAPALTVIATSRQPLDVAGEHVLAVRPLPLPAADPHGPETPAGHAGGQGVSSEAVTLFLERARAAVPDLVVDEHDRDALTELCRRLDGLPLALEIAARRLRGLSVPQLLERLDRVPLLGEGGGERAAHPRHQTLRGVFDWSFDLCSRQEQTAWMRLSACADGVAPDAAEALCADAGLSAAETVEAVAGLVDKSLLVKVDAAGGPRVRMLQTVRAYGRERLEATGTSAAVRLRHAAWFLDLAARAGAHYDSPRQLAWFHRLRDEHADLCLALDTALSEGRTGDDRGVRTLMAGAGGLWLYWVACGKLHEGAHWMRRVMERFPDPPRSHLAPQWCRMAWGASFVLLLHGDAATALAWASWVEQVAEGGAAGPESGGLSAAVAQLRGLAALFAGEWAECRAQSRKALPGLRAAGDGLGVQQALAQSAMAASIEGDPEGAIATYRDVLARAEAGGEVWHRSYALWGLAVEYLELGRTREASDLLARSLQWKQSFGDRIGTATVGEALAWVHARDGRPQTAARLLGATHNSWHPVEQRLFGFSHLIESRERCVREVQEALGPAGYADEYRAGSELGITHLLATALAHAPEPGEEGS